jgi:hypothetical protein
VARTTLLSNDFADPGKFVGNPLVRGGNIIEAIGKFTEDAYVIARHPG